MTSDDSEVPGGVANTVEGDVSGVVFQVGRVAGGLHFHQNQSAHGAGGTRGSKGLPIGLPPFPGLAPFNKDLRWAFFGRARETEELAGWCLEQAETGSGRLILVMGPSGAGKSSLVLAGLWPRLDAEPGWLALSPVKPGADPVGALAAAFAGQAVELGMRWTPSGVAERLERACEQDTAREVHRLVGDLLAAGAPGGSRRLLVVLDQFEGVLQYATGQDQRRFAEVLAAALSGPVTVVATLRSEYIGRVQSAAEFAPLESMLRPYLVALLHTEALRTVIREPAALAGIAVDEDLVTSLVTDTDSGSGLPLLAFALQQLARDVGRGGALSAARYAASGGVQRILTSAAERALRTRLDAGRAKVEVLESLLLLVGIGATGPFARRVRRADLSAEIDADLAPFVEQRLVVSDSDPTSGEAVVTMAHDRLLVDWPQLKAAIEEETVAIRARGRLSDAANEWRAANRPRSLLWPPERLLLAAPAVGHRTGGRRRLSRSARLVAALPEPERSFAQTSRRYFRRRRTALTATLSVLLVAAIGLAGLARLQYMREAAAARLAIARGLVAEAERLRTTDPRRALQLGVAAVSIEADPLVRASLVNTVTTTRLAGTITGDPIGFTANGTHVLTTIPADDDVPLDPADIDTDTGIDTGISRDRVVVWAMPEAAPVRRVSMWPTRAIEGLGSSALSSDGRTLVVEEAGYLRLWDVTDPEHGRLIGSAFDRSFLSAFALSSDGRELAVVSDGTVSRWDLTDRVRPQETGQAVVVAAGTDDSNLGSVALSPDGRVLAVTLSSGPVELWSALPPEPLQKLATLSVSLPGEGHEPLGRDDVRYVVFSQDNRFAAVAAVGGVVLVDVSDPAHPRTVGEPMIGALGPAFSPDSRTLAVDSGDMVDFWDITESAPRRVGSMPVGDDSDGLLFAPNGQWLLTGTQWRGASLWRTHDQEWPTGRGPAVELDTPGTALAVARTWVATNGPAGQVVLRSADGTPLATFTSGADNGVATLAADADGTLLAVGGGTGDDQAVVELWDVTDPRHPARRAAPTRGTLHTVTRLMFDTDGRSITVGDAEYVVQWDIRSPELPLTAGHSYGSYLSNHRPRPAVSSPQLTVAQIIVSVTADDVPMGGPVALWPVNGVGGSDGQYLHGPGATGSTVEFDPAGEVLAVGGVDGSLTLWDHIAWADHNQHRRNLPVPAHSSPVSAIAFTSDGRIAMTAGHDGTLTAWLITENGPLRLTGMIDSGTVVDAAFSTDNRTLFTISGSGTLRRWDTGQLIDMLAAPTRIACTLTGDGLPPEDWSTYVVNEPYRDTCP